MSIPVEIERKFVIAKPDIETLSCRCEYTVSEIDQTYLESHEGVTHRVRARSYKGRTVYTETKKVRIDRTSAFEDEREIGKEEYDALLLKRMPGTVTLKKTRHTFRHLDRVIEIDIYPDWQRSCILEVELDSSDDEVRLPDFIKVVREVTGDKKYSNASMSRKFPEELI